MSQLKRITRREFLSSAAAASAVVGVGAIGLSKPAVWARANPNPSNPEQLRGFVVSDVHIGWFHREHQPSNEQIAAAWQQIQTRFPDLDLMMDSGDATHTYAGIDAYGHWTDILQSGCGKRAFHFCGGNHDLNSPRFPSEDDPEQDMMRLGSIPHRGFYSFDLKNVHFVILPQLMSVALLTNEALDWLDLDLSLNRDKTVIIISHQALLDTTWPDAKTSKDVSRKASDPTYGYTDTDGTYRLLANTDQVREIFKEYPNIVAWLHGHNHNWDMVYLDETLVISNGRLGGFDPHSNDELAGQIGGIFFEVKSNSVEFRGYSANENKWLDTFDGWDRLRQIVEVSTSLDASRAPTVSYGNGRAINGQHWPIYQHYVGSQNKKRELFIANSKQLQINDDPNIRYCLTGFRGQHLSAFNVGPNLSPDNTNWDDTWEFLNPGIRLKSLSDLNQRRLIRWPHGSGQQINWRTPPGTRYRAIAEIETEGPGPQARLVAEFSVASATDHEVDTYEQNTTYWEGLIPGTKQTLELEFEVPELTNRHTVYSHPDKADLQIRTNMVLQVENLESPVKVTRLLLTYSNGESVVRNPSIEIAGTKLTHQGALADGEVAEFELPAPTQTRELAKLNAQGKGMMTWLVRHQGLRWQVRNAPAIEHADGSIEIGPLRNTFSNRREVILAPLVAPQGPWVHRMQQVDQAILHPFDQQANRLEVYIKEGHGYARVEIQDVPSEPRIIEEAELIEYENGRLVFGLRTERDRTVAIQF